MPLLVPVILMQRPRKSTVTMPFHCQYPITMDLNQIFKVLERKLIIPKLKYLLVSPFTIRITFLDLIQQEIANARAGRMGKSPLR